jgi:hypothetical protein
MRRAPPNDHNLQNHEIALTGTCTICHHFDSLFGIQIAQEAPQREKPTPRTKRAANCTRTWFHKTLEAKKKGNEKKSPLVVWAMNYEQHAGKVTQHGDADAQGFFTLWSPAPPYRGRGATSTRRAIWPDAAAG